MPDIVLTLRSERHAVPRRYATAFLTRGHYLLSLDHPADGPSDDDCRAWTAWRLSEPRDNRWINRFSLWSPGLPRGAQTQFGTGGKATKDEAFAAFNGLPEGERRFEIVATQGAAFGHPVVVYIHDEKDDDNIGGLLIRISPR